MTPTTPADSHAQYQSGPLVLLTLDAPFGNPRPEMFLLEQEVKSKVPAEIAKSPKIRRLRRMREG